MHAACRMALTLLMQANVMPVNALTSQTAQAPCHLCSCKCSLPHATQVIVSAFAAYRVFGVISPLTLAFICECQRQAV